ncbi:MAG: hypothetical protein LBV42_00355, partial [Methanobrevibacter sp.]|nr:hypothetical protein [Methanobrevibacter sp.]
MKRKGLILTGIILIIIIVLSILLFTHFNSSNLNSKNLEFIQLGSNENGTVELIGPIGNTSSNVKIAYIIGIHPLESFAHKMAYDTLFEDNSSLKYCYYIYRINVTKNPNVYELGRMAGQLLGHDYVVSNVTKGNYTIVLDIHSNEAASGYAKNDSVFAPANNSQSKKIAERIVSESKTIIYFYPEPQTSPTFVTIPIINSGIPTIIFESNDGESEELKAMNIKKLISTVDNLSFS